MTAPDHINPFQWHQAMGVARQACARIFRDGGRPADALAAFGLKDAVSKDWSKDGRGDCRGPVPGAASQSGLIVIDFPRTGRFGAPFSFWRQGSSSVSQ
jgi:hypothetical protein